MGLMDRLTGRVKQAAGDLAGDEGLRRQGQQEERKGEAKDEARRAEERAETERELADARAEAHEAHADRKAAEAEGLEQRTDPGALADSRTREDLYDEAQALGVERRADMTKDELAEEITRRR